MNDLAGNVALTATLTLLPLLPAGPQYFGVSSTWWTEAVLILLVAIRYLSPDRRPAPMPSPLSASRLAWAFVPFAVAMTGAALVGLAEDNPFTSQAFREQVTQGWTRLFAPMNQVVDPLNPLRVWLTLLEGPAAFLLVAAICRRAADPVRRARAALWGALAGVLIVSAFAIVQYFTRYQLQPYWVLANPNLVRTHSTLDDPNALGSYLVLGLGLSAALALDGGPGRSGKWSARLAAAVGLVAAGALLTTVSRAAWAAVVIAGLAGAAYGPPLASATANGRAPRYRRWARAGIGVCVGLMVVWIFARVLLPHRAGRPPTGLVQVVTSTIDPRLPMAEVLKQRQVFWVAALRMAYRHAVAGVGLGRFPRLASDYNQGATWRDNAHNFFLQILAETGLAGFAGFLLLAAAAVQTLRVVARTERERGLAWGLSFACAGFTLTLLSGHPLLLSSIQIVCGSMFAAGLVASGTLAPGPPWHPSWRRAFVVLSSVAVLTYAAAFARATWDGVDAVWGYSWGLYEAETDSSGQPFRWASSAANVYARIPPGADSALMTIGGFPTADSATRTVTIRAGARRFEVPCHSWDWCEVRIPLDDSTTTRGGLEIRLDVDHVGVPAADGISQDVRALGFRLRPLAWRIRR